jgi:hypothetical protein
MGTGELAPPAGASDDLQRLFQSLNGPQRGQLSGAGITTRSRGRCSGNGLCDGRLRWKDLTVCV